MNTNKTNKIHWIVSGWKCVPGFFRDFADIFWLHSRDSRFIA